MSWHFKFDWRGFDDSCLQLAKIREKNHLVDAHVDICSMRFVLQREGKKKQEYFVDISYYYFSSTDKGFILDVYKELDYGDHTAWIGSIESIKSASDAKRFCRRVENELIRYLPDMIDAPPLNKICRRKDMHDR